MAEKLIPTEELVPIDQIGLNLSIFDREEQIKKDRKAELDGINKAITDAFIEDLKVKRQEKFDKLEKSGGIEKIKSNVAKDFKGDSATINQVSTVNILNALSSDEDDFDTLARKYDTFWDATQRERIKGMSQRDVDNEIKTGGTEQDTFTQTMSVFTDTFASHLSLGFFDPDKKSIYGRRRRDLHPVAQISGAVLGELTAFYAMFGVANGIGASTGLANLATKSNEAKAILQVTGWAPTKIASIKNFMTTTSKLSQYEMVNRGSAAAISAGINSLADTVKSYNDRYNREDSISKKQWENGLPAPVEGFFRGYGMTVINAPQNRAIRVVADTLFSLGQQGWAAVNGRQEGFSKQQFWTDFGTNLLIGEGVVGHFYSMTKKTIDSRVNSDPVIKNFWEKIQKDPYWQDLPENQKMYMTEAMRMSEGAGAKEAPDSINDQTRQHIYDFFKKEHANGFGELLETSFTRHVHEIDPTDLNYPKGSDKNVLTPLKRVGLTDKDIDDALTGDILISKDVFGRFLTERGFEVKSNADTRSIGEALRGIDGMDLQKFQNLMGGLYTRFTALKPNTSNKKSLDALAGFKDIDNFFKNNDDIFNSVRKHHNNYELKEFISKPWKMVPVPDEDKVTKIFIDSLIKENADYDLINRILAGDGRTKITNNKDFYIRMFEYIHDPRNQAAIKEINEIDTTPFDKKKRVYRLSINNSIREISGVSPNEILKIQDISPDHGMRGRVFDETSTTKFKDLTKLYLYAKESPNNMLGALMVYQKRFKGEARVEALQGLLRAHGIKNIDNNKLIEFINKTESEINKIDIQNKKTKISVDDISDPIIKKTYSLNEFDTLYRSLVQKKNALDPETGIKKSFTEYRDKKNIKKSSGYALDFSTLRRNVALKYGDEIANRAVIVAKKIVKANLDADNKFFSRDDIGERQHLDLASPSKDSLIIWGNNIPHREVDAFAKDIQNVLRNKYSGERKNWRRSFVMSINDGTGIKKYIRTTGDVHLTMSKSVDDLAVGSKVHEKFIKMLRVVNANHWAFKESILLDMDDFKFGELRSVLDDLPDNMDANFIREAMANSNLRDRFINAVQGSGYIERIPWNLPPRVERKERVKNSEVMGGSKQEQMALAEEGTRQIDSFNMGSSSESVLDILNKFTQDNYVINKIVDFNTQQKTVEQMNDMIITPGMNKLAALETSVKEAAGKTRGIFGKIGGFFSKTKEDLSITAEEKFDIFGNEARIKNFMKTIAQGTFADKNKLDSDLGDFIFNVFNEQWRKAFGHLDARVAENNSQAFNKVLGFAYEIEYKRLIDPVTGRFKENIVDELDKPINWSSPQWQDLPKIFEQASDLDGQKIVSIQKQTADPLIYSKLITQIIGVPKDVYIESLLRVDMVTTGLLKKLWINASERQGTYLSLDTQRKFKKTLETNIVNLFLEKTNNGRAIAEDQLDWDKPADVAKFKNLIEKYPADKETGELIISPELREQLLERIKTLETTDFSNLSFVHHNVKAKPGGEREFNSAISQYAGETKVKSDDPEAGKQTLQGGSGGSDSNLRTTIKAMQGRVHPTQESLINTGHLVSINFIDNLGGQLKYLMQKTYNYSIADGLKERFTLNFRNAAEPIKALDDELREAIKLKVPLESETQKYHRLKSIVDKQSEMYNHMLKFFAENDAFFYRPVAAEFSRIEKQVGELNKKIDELTAMGEGNEKAIANLKASKESIVMASRDMRMLNSIYSGEAVVRGRAALDKFVSNSKDKDLKKEFGSSEQFAANELKRTQDQAKYVEDIFYNLYGTRDLNYIRMNPYMPLDGTSYAKDKIQFKPHATNPDVVQKLLNGSIQTRIERMGLKSIDNAVGFEGIYMNKTVMAGMQQFLFRGDMEIKKEGFESLNQTLNKYDQVNSWFKRITLIKPQIMFWNDNAQGLLARNLFTIEAGKGYIDALNLLINKKNDPLMQEVYHNFDQVNMFNKVVGASDMQNDAYIAASKFLLKDDKLGMKDYLKENLVRNGADPIQAENSARTILQKITVDTVKSGARAMNTGIRSVQEAAWWLDEYLRLAVALPLHKRATEANLGMGMKPKDAAQKAYRDVADYVNDYMVEYARIPKRTRRMLNRVFAYPTYRVGTLRMYKAMFTDFGKGVARSFNFNPDARLQVSNKRYEQVLFETGPLFRKIAAVATIKLLAQTMFGGGFEDTKEALLAYRVRRRTGDNFWNQTVGVMSFGTPLFELEKYASRPWRLTLENNMAAFPRLGFSLLNNKHPFNGGVMHVTPWSKDPKRAMWETTTSLWFWFAPYMEDIRSFSKPDQELWKKMFNFSGLGFAYDLENPQQLQIDYAKSISEAKTREERKAALTTLDRNIYRMRQQWFGAASDEDVILSLRTGTPIETRK